MDETVQNLIAGLVADCGVHIQILRETQHTLVGKQLRGIGREFAVGCVCGRSVDILVVIELVEA